MRTTSFHVFALLFFFANGYELFAEGRLNLSKDGKALVQIVVGKNAIESEKNAALELQKYLKKITSAHFEIISENDTSKDACIYIGGGEYVDRNCKDADFDSLGTDGIIIRSVDDNLILTGGRPRGSLYAVYTFLQDYLDCRWYAPDEEKIPLKSDLSINPIDFKYVPQIHFREYFCLGATDPIFSAKLRLNGREFMSDIPLEYGGNVRMGGAHTLFNTFVKPSEHFEQHPEWYAWRQKEEKRVEAQLCMTNPQVQQQVLEEVLKYLEDEYSKMPAYHKWVSVSCPDNNTFCQCENCADVIEKENTPAGPLIELVNFVAKGVKESYPDVCINTLAYWHTDLPPNTLKCEDNVIVQIGTLDRNHKLTIGHTRFHNIIQGWRKVAKHIYIWDYDANFKNFIQPHPNHFIIEESLKYYAKNDVEGVFVQGPWGAAGELYPMRTWVHAQMMWDGRKDYRELITEFCNAYYGPGGKYILQYIKLINEAVDRNKAFFLGAYATNTDGWLMLDDMNNATKLFAEAMKAVEGNPKLTRRVRLAKLSIDIVWMQRYRELLQEAQNSGKKFLGPKDPYVEMDLLEENEFGVDTYREWAPYSEYLQMLREKFPKRTSSLPHGFETCKPWQWEDIQEGLFACKELDSSVEVDPNASNKKALVVKGDLSKGDIIYTVPDELAGIWHVLVNFRAVPAEGYDSVDVPVCVYYRPYPGKGITEVARAYLNFTGNNCENYQLADLGVRKLGPGTEIQIQPNGVGHFGKTNEVYVDRIVLISDTKVL